MDRCAHNAEYACFDCETAEHAALHPTEVDGCRSCKYGTIRLSQSCMPSKTPGKAPPRGGGNSWEQGVATDHRGVPYLDKNLDTIGVKQFAENRSKFTEQIRRNAQSA